MRYLLILASLFFINTAYAENLSIKSNALSEGGTIPTLYTCNGKDISPELSWTNAPDKTQSLALIISDPDAPGGVFYHWVIYNISSTIKELAENKVPAGTIGKNSYDKTQYNGPCPPPGKLHHYIFTLYALDTKLNLSADIDAITLEKAMNGHILGSTTLTGLFSR
jgi:Raf kinase inhibitor-like YbhB/YbcL family protein